ncbi:MAG: DUF402 domain-containing protein [Lachnospiraceae bacterium]|nr:DUF402 domain-containing protein [Lachnospiraceae bacterium]
MESIKLYRKRFIPEEIVFLKDDVILEADEDNIITKWDTLKPREDFVSGYSYYYLKKGYKISKLIDGNGELVYYYCDIIDVNFDNSENSYIFTDLLADVIVYEDGRVKVVDLAEIAEALDRNLITQELAKKALRILDELLNIIYNSGIQILLCSEMRVSR